MYIWPSECGSPTRPLPQLHAGPTFRPGTYMYVETEPGRPGYRLGSGSPQHQAKMSRSVGIFGSERLTQKSSRSVGFSDPSKRTILGRSVDFTDSEISATKWSGRSVDDAQTTLNFALPDRTDRAVKREESWVERS